MITAYADADAYPPAAPSIGAAFSWGWNTFKQQIVPWMLVGLVAVVLSGAEQAFEKLFPEGVLRGAAWFLGVVLSAISMLGISHVSLRAHDEGVMPAVPMLFEPINRIAAAIGAYLLFVLLLVVGLICLIIPGLIVLAGFSFFAYRLVDGASGAIDALSESWELTKGHRLGVFGLSLASFAVLMLGLLALGVGVFAAYPVVFLAWAHYYRQLRPREATEGATGTW